MVCDCARLTVYFEDPFWVGVYEREEGEGLTACKLTFGAEPRDQEVYELLLTAWRRLEFGPPVAAGRRVAPPKNPKRRQREAAEALGRRGAGTKAQQAIQLQREENKREKQLARRARSAAEEERQFQLRREKKKEKHRGR